MAQVQECLFTNIKSNNTNIKINKETIEISATTITKYNPNFSTNIHRYTEIQILRPTVQQSRKEKSTDFDDL